jgi:hypothetical protein
MHPLVPVRKETGIKGLDERPLFLLVHGTCEKLNLKVCSITEYLTNINQTRSRSGFNFQKKEEKGELAESAGSARSRAGRPSYTTAFTGGEISNA